jgi:hypothetical protein
MLSVPVLPRTGYYLPLKIPPVLRIGILNKVVLSVVDRHLFETFPDLHPTFHFDVDPDPDPDPTLTLAHVGKSDFFYKFIHSSTGTEK